MKKRDKNKIKGRSTSACKTAVLVIFAVIAVLVCGTFAYIKVYKPSVDRHGPYYNPTIVNKANLSDKGPYKLTFYESLRGFLDNAKEASANRPTEYKRLDGVYNFLVVGKDKVALNTDVIMVVNYNVNDGKLSIMQIPRDTYIEYDGYAHKINSMMAYMFNKAVRAKDKTPYNTAMRDFADLLEKSMSIEIDNYALVNLDAFSNIVDIIGGVPLDVPYDMDYEDEFQDLYIHIKKGYQVLDGETAAKFVRFRSGYVQADIGRTNAQKLLMTALIKQVKASFTVDKIAKIVEQVMKNVTTDMALGDAVYYAKSALSIDMSQITMLTLPGVAINDGYAWYYVLYRNSVIEIINKYFNVYDSDITDALFDRSLCFTDESNKTVNDIYRRTDVSYDVNTGDSIDSDGIYIPLLDGVHTGTQKPPEPEVTTGAVTEAVTETSDTTGISADSSESAVTDDPATASDTVASESTADSETIEVSDSAEASDTDMIDETDDTDCEIPEEE